MVKLTIEEENFIEDLVKHAKNLYGGNWASVLKKATVPLPRKGFHERSRFFHEFDMEEEEKTIKQLQKKNIVVIRQEEVDVQNGGSFQEKYGDGNDKFIGIRPQKLRKLRHQLNLDG